jgi:hypothetical protein
MEKREVLVTVVLVLLFVSIVPYLDEKVSGMLVTRNLAYSPSYSVSGPIGDYGGGTYPSGIKAWYKFDDIPNDGVDDSSGNGYGGYCTDCPNLINNGKFNYAYDFNGVDDFIDLGNHLFGIDVSDELTISFWIKIDQVGSGYATIIGRDKYVNPFHIQLVGSQIRTRLRAGGQTDTLVSSGSLNLGEWYNVVLTYKSGDKKLYVNGNIDNNIQTGNIETTNKDTHIGNRPLGNDEFFKGVLDEILIYDRALSVSEVDSLFEGGSGGLYKLECKPGKTKLCPLQEGVCAGAFEICTFQGRWEGCGVNEYGLDWEDSFELTCDDGLDNDCDIVYDDEANNPVSPDPDCPPPPGCEITNAYWEIV